MKNAVKVNVGLLFNGRLSGRYVSNGRFHAENAAWAEYRRWIYNGGLEGDLSRRAEADRKTKAAAKAEEVEAARLAALAEYFGKKTEEERAARLARYIRRANRRPAVICKARKTREPRCFMDRLVRKAEGIAALHRLMIGRQMTAKARRVRAAAEAGRESLRQFVGGGCKVLVTADVVRREILVQDLDEKADGDEKAEFKPNLQRFAAKETGFCKFDLRLFAENKPLITSSTE